MPALKPCGRPWNVGSDDFGLASLFAIAVRIVCVGLFVGVAFYLYIGPPECGGFEDNVPPLLYGPLLALIAIEVMVLCNEAVILSISCRGKIWYEDNDDSEDKEKDQTTNLPTRIKTTHPRRHFLLFLFMRVGLYFVEFGLVVFNTITFFGSFITDGFECEAYRDGPLIFGQVISVVLLVVLILYAVGFLVYSDPLGCCCAPPIMKDMSDVEEIGQKDLDELDEAHKNHLKKKHIGKVHTSHLGNGRVLRKIRGLFCCSSAGGRRSRAVAVQEMSAALSTLFSDQDWVPSDLVAGLILVSRNQRSKREQCGCSIENGPCTCLIKGFKELTFKYMPKEHQKLSRVEEHSMGDTGSYVYKPPQHFDFNNLEKQLLFENLVHYMRYSMAIYGWPLHVFDNLCCGFCQLGTVTCCRCNYSWRHKRFGVDFIQDGCCMTGVGTIRLKSKLSEENIRMASYENEVYQAPFSVCVDKQMKAVVITIRGTLSIQDALTDLSVSMYNPSIKGFKQEETYIHNGIYRTAKTILMQLHERNIIEDLFSKECWDYQLVVTGHSLGAGVASALALLLRANHSSPSKPYYRDLKCYAFSPPGCIFSFPLALYSRRFITTVVLGNDMIPRVTFPSLLYLKRQMLFLLKTSKKSKPQILFQPRAFENNRLFKFCCGSQEDSDEGVEEIQKEVLQESTFKQDLTRGHGVSISAVFAAKAAGKRWKKKAKSDKGDTLHHFVKAIQSRDQIASFPPGNVIHLQVGKSARACCLGFCYPNQLQVYEVSSEDFGVIMIDKGMIDDHLPNEVLGALNRSKQQCMGHRDKTQLASLRKEVQEKLTEDRMRLKQQRLSSEPESPAADDTMGNGAQLNVIQEEPLRNGQTLEVCIEIEDESAREPATENGGPVDGLVTMV